MCEKVYFRFIEKVEDERNLKNLGLTLNYVKLMKKIWGVLTQAQVFDLLEKKDRERRIESMRRLAENGDWNEVGRKVKWCCLLFSEEGVSFQVKSVSRKKWQKVLWRRYFCVSFVLARTFLSGNWVSWEVTKLNNSQETSNFVLKSKDVLFSVTRVSCFERHMCSVLCTHGL